MRIRRFVPRAGGRRGLSVTVLMTALIVAGATGPVAAAGATGAGSATSQHTTQHTAVAAAQPSGSEAPSPKSAVQPKSTLPGQTDLAGAFVPAGPARLLDTRNGTGTNGVVRPLGQSPLLLDVSQITGSASVTPTAVVLNVTVTNPTGDSYLAVYPAGTTRPDTSNLNFGPGQTVPNLVTVPVGSDGKVAFFNHIGTTDVVADLAGYYTLDKAASTYVANGPTRVLDTRSGTGTGGVRAPVGEGRSIGLKVAGVAGVPAASVTAVVLNVTVTNPTGDSFLTVYPSGKSVPTASNLNFGRGQTVPNLVTVPVGADGKVAFFNHIGTVDVVADIAGYYVSGAPKSGGVFQTLDAPKRLLDTRAGTGTGGVRAPVGEGRSIGLKVAGTAGIPSTSVTAVVLNVTVTNPTGDSFLTVYPSGKSVPTASNLNFGRGQTVPNLVTVPVGADGKVAFFNHIGTVDVVADVFGYFSAGDELGLSALSFSSSTVDASAGGASVTVKWTVTDSNPAATQVGGSIVIRQQGDAPDTYVGRSYVVDYLQDNACCGMAEFVSGNAASSTYSYTFAVPQYAGKTTAKWAVSLVNIFENATQQRQIRSGSALSGFGSVLTATEQVPTVAPIQPSLDLDLNGRPPFLYAGDNGTGVAYRISMQDSQSGFWKGTLELTGPGGKKLSKTFEYLDYNGQSNDPCQHEVKYPTCSAYVLIPAGTAPGTWTVSSVTVTNNAGQTKAFTKLDALPVTVTSNNVVSADRFTTTPRQLNSWMKEAPFKVSMRVNGARNGVTSIELNWWGDCRNGSTTPALEPDGSYSVPVVLGQSRNGSPAGCTLKGLAIRDGAGNLALYGQDYYGAPDPGLSVKSVADTTPPTASSAKLNVTSIPRSQLGTQSLYITAKVFGPTAPVDGFSTYVYDSTGKEVGQSFGGLSVGPDGEAMLGLYLPYDAPVGTYTVGFKITDAGWLSSSYGMPGKQPVPGGPLILTVTAG